MLFFLGDAQRAMNGERIKIPKTVINRANAKLFENDELKIVVNRAAFKRQKKFKYHDAQYILRFIEMEKRQKFPDMSKYAGSTIL